MCGGQMIICRSQLSPPPTEFLWTELILSGLVVGTFLPLICWPQNVLYCCHHHPLTPTPTKKKAVSLCSLGTHYADKLRGPQIQRSSCLSPSAGIKVRATMPMLRTVMWLILQHSVREYSSSHLDRLLSHQGMEKLNVSGKNHE